MTDKNYAAFYCSHCKELLSGINTHDSESMEEGAQSIIDRDKFTCSCGVTYQFGLFDLKTNKAIKPKMEYF